MLQRYSPLTPRFSSSSSAQLRAESARIPCCSASAWLAKEDHPVLPRICFFAVKVSNPPRATISTVMDNQMP